MDEPVPDRPDQPADRWVLAAFLAVAALRVLAIVGRHPYIYVDSIDYETLDFTGSARRPWATPLLYSISEDVRIRALLQCLIGALCWMALAREAGAATRDRRVGQVALGAVLVLSLTTTVTNWDNTMLSESLALSFTALLAARLLAFARVPTVAHAGWVVAAATPWFFTRQNHLVLGILVVVAAGTALAVAARRRLPTVRPLAVLAGGLAAVAVLATASYRQNTEVVHFNVAMVIGNRVLLNQDAAEWFFDHGMPTLPAGIQVGVPTNPEPLLADRRFGAWVREEGTGTYLRFLAVHPWVTLTAPLDDFVSERPSFADPPHPDESMLATRESYAAARDVLPEPLGNLLYHPGQTGTVLALLLLTGVLTAFRWADGGPDPRWIVPLLLIGLQWPALTVTWHASAAELGRLALTSSIALRIGLIVQLALLADAWLADRFSGGSGSLGDPDPPENGP